MIGTTGLRRALLCAVATCACTAQPDVAAVRRELDSRRTQFERAIRDNDAAAMARFYAPDALIFPPGAEPVRGRNAIQSFLTRPRDYEIGHDIQELGHEGETVLEFGQWTRTAKQDGTVPGGGWYFWLWRRQPDGSWLVDRELWSGTAAPAGQGGAPARRSRTANAGSPRTSSS